MNRMSFRVIDGGRDTQPAFDPRSPAPRDDLDPARAIVAGVVYASVVWGIGAVVWWGWWSGACR